MRRWRLASTMAGLQVAALVLMVVVLLRDSWSPAVRSAEFGGLQAFFDDVAALACAVVAVLAVVSVFGWLRERRLVTLGVLLELVVLSASLYLRHWRGWVGSEWAPFMAATAVVIVMCVLGGLPRATAAIASSALAVAVMGGLIVRGQPSLPSFGPPPAGIAGSIIFEGIHGCLFRVAPRAGATPTALPCDLAHSWPSYQPMGQIGSCLAQRVIGAGGAISYRDRSAARACLALPNGALITRQGPTDYYFREGELSPDRQWIAFTDTTSRLLVAATDGTGPWLVCTGAGDVEGWDSRAP